MQRHYRDGNEGKAKVVTEMSSYATCYKDTWQRVVVKKVMDPLVQCYAVDYGLEYYVPKTDIFHLDKYFEKFEAQVRKENSPQKLYLQFKILLLGFCVPT